MENIVTAAKARDANPKFASAPSAGGIAAVGLTGGIKSTEFTHIFTAIPLRTIPPPPAVPRGDE